MADLHDIGDHMARACECGCVRFNLLRSGSIECDNCQRKQESINWSQSINKNNGAIISAEPVFMVPYIKNFADMVDGHYCIARLNHRGYHEFWNSELKRWCSAGTVFELGKAL